VTNIIDLGSHTIKAGRDNTEEVVFIPNISGYKVVGGQNFLKVQQYRQHDESKFKFCGTDATDKSQWLSLRFPMENGIIQDFDAIETMLHTCIDTNSSLNNLVMTQSPM